MFLNQQVKQYKIGFLTTSDIEIRDLFRAWIAISIAFAIMLTGGDFFSYQMLYNFFLAAFSVGIGFIVHELGHKVVAQHYGCFAEFRAFTLMLGLAILMSFMGFFFAAPGAVMIQGPVGVRRNGKISLAGPLMNIIIALIFLSNLLLFPFTGFLQNLFTYGFMINTWLALFNLIPIWNLDGKKILAWNKWIYGAMIGISIILMVVQGSLFSF